MLTFRLRWMARLSLLIALLAGVVGLGLSVPSNPVLWVSLAALALIATGLAWIWSQDAQAEARAPAVAVADALAAALRSTHALRQLAADPSLPDQPGDFAASKPRSGDENDMDSITERAGRLAAAHEALAAALMATRNSLAEMETASDSEQRLFDRCPEALLVVDHDGSIKRANQAARVLLADMHDAHANAMAWDFFADPEAFLAALDKARGRGNLQDVELALRRLDGTARTVSIAAVALPAAGPEPMALLLAMRDVSAGRRDERAAQLRATRFRALLDAGIEPVMLVDGEGKLIDANAATLDLIGLSAEGLSSASLYRLFTDPEAAERQVTRAYGEGKVRDVSLVMRRRDGVLLDVLLSADVFRDAQGVPGGLFVNIRDVSAIREAERLRLEKEWVIAGIARLNVLFQVIAQKADFARTVITELAEYAGAQVGAFYVRDDSDGAMVLLASHAFTHRKTHAPRFMPGEGILGQAVMERKQVHIGELPPDYLVVASGLGETPARHLYVTPLQLDTDVKGVLEIASIAALDANALSYLAQAAPIITVAYEATAAREIAAAALAKAQQLASELEAQQDQLRNTNAELEEQTASLQASEQKLQQQQAEIELANSELQQQNELLEQQRDETEKARKSLVMQAQEVALASKYKSEFLANMSHELRTPLNSLLLLARSLRDNATGNLSDDQVESAGVIFDSGSDLLNIINEILDLSKIEAGKMELRLSDVDTHDVARTLVSQFEHMAHAQGLVFRVITDPVVPARIVTDPQRLGQILKNLIGNALKFTEQGSVSVRFARPSPDALFRRAGFDISRAIAVHVTDTGIGIPENQQKIIFEAFQQADSGDKRRYGGTGLGLSISRELANLLGGEIHVTSEPGKGSTFTLYIPETLADPRQIPESGIEAASAPPLPAQRAPAPTAQRPARPAVTIDRERPNVEQSQSPLSDDHGSIGAQDRVILLIEDDLRFSKILIEHVRQRGFKCLHATSGESGVELARVFRPHGVILDIELPGMDGWAVLSELKQDLSLRHIPVHIVSAEPASNTNLGIGAIGHATKPVAHEQIDAVLAKIESASAHAAKRVLVVEDDALMRAETVRVIGNGNVKADAVGTAKEALAYLAATSYDLVVMDLGLPDMPGMELLQTWAKTTAKMPPVIIHTVRELTMEEELFLRNFSDSIIIKDVRSQERLIDEVALFLHRVVQELPEEKRQAIFHLRQSDEPLRGKKVLIVEDDMRTMFAMARMLAGHGVHPVKAENGERALEVLAEHPDTDLVLLDMMMPIMDGYEVAKRLRENPTYAQLPVIALTAKAMREDRQRCLDAGCTDYLSKPVDPDRLTSLMRVLLFR